MPTKPKHIKRRSRSPDFLEKGLNRKYSERIILPRKYLLNQERFKDSQEELRDYESEKE